MYSRCRSVFKKGCYCISPEFSLSARISAVCNGSLFFYKNASTLRVPGIGA